MTGMHKLKSGAWSYGQEKDSAQPWRKQDPRDVSKQEELRTPGNRTGISYRILL